MTQPVVAVLGLSGVGKSTILRQLATHVSFQHLQASVIIRAAREAQAIGRVSVDELRQASIDDNQALLIAGFSAARDPLAPIVVLDGHSVVDTPHGLVRIPAHVFAELSVELFIFLADDPKTIAARREQDKTRQRPIRHPSELAQHQLEALENSFAAARMQNVPLLVFSPNHSGAIRSALMSTLMKNQGLDHDNASVWEELRR